MTAQGLRGALTPVRRDAGSASHPDCLRLETSDHGSRDVLVCNRNCGVTLVSVDARHPLTRKGLLVEGQCGPDVQPIKQTGLVRV